MVIGQSRVLSKVQYDYGEVCHQRGGKMGMDIFTFTNTPLVCVRTHQGVVTFCFHNLHRNRVEMRYDEL